MMESWAVVALGMRVWDDYERELKVWEAARG